MGQYTEGNIQIEGSNKVLEKIAEAIKANEHIEADIRNMDLSDQFLEITVGGDRYSYCTFIMASVYKEVMKFKNDDVESFNSDIWTPESFLCWGKGQDEDDVNQYL